MKKKFVCLLKLDSLIENFTFITACDKLIMHCTYEAIILQHHQIQSSKGAREKNLKQYIHFLEYIVVAAVKTARYVS